MAIYSLHAQVISRAYGESSIAACAYRRGICLTDKETGLKSDYSRRKGAIYNELSVPKDSPQWVLDLRELNKSKPVEAASTLWNMVESKENRCDSELSREYRIALPIELNASQNIELVRKFVESTFSTRGIISDWSIHFDSGNPHVHIMNTTRYLEENGFGNKDTDLGKLKFLYFVREAWENSANQELARLGFDVTIDRRSNEERGFKVKATKHLGKKVIEQERRGIKTERMKEHRAIQAENLKLISENPEILFDAMAQESPTFSDEKIAQALSRYINPHDGETSILPSEMLAANEKNYTETVKQIIHNEKLNDIHSAHQAESSGSVDKLIIESAVLDSIHQSESEIKPLAPSFFKKLLKTIENHEAVFSEKTIASELFKLNPHASHEQFTQTLIQVKTYLRDSGKVLSLGIGDDGREKFTTRAMFKLENSIQEITDKLNQTKHSTISQKTIDAVLAQRLIETGKELIPEQKAALLHMLQPQAISCLVGRAGTGKSFTMGTLRAVYEKAGYRVQGVALSGIAADGLDRDAGISSKTIKAFEFALKNDWIQLSKNDVIVMDESGMTDSHSMHFVLEAAQKAQAKVILVGDPEQLQPVGPGAVFRAILERIAHVKLEFVYRQEEIWQKEATSNFANGHVRDAILAYHEKDCVHLDTTEQEALNHLAKDWQATFKSKKNIAEQIVITYRNTDVQLLNNTLRQLLVDSGHLSEGYNVETAIGIRKIAKDDRILFLKNKRSLGVSNGRFATITHVKFTESGQVINFSVRLDGTDKDILIDPEKYNDFDYGYAATIHKTQGITKFYSFVYAAGNGWDRALAYVAMTRHKFTANLYAAQTHFPDLEHLIRSFSSLSLKDSVLNFPLAFAKRRGIEPNAFAITAHLAKNLRKIKEDLSHRYQQWKNPQEFTKKQNEQRQREEALSALDKQRNDAVMVAEYADQYFEASRLAKLIKEELTTKGLTNNKTDAFEAAKQASIHYQSLKNAVEARDRLAAQIYPNHDYHKRAIELNRMDVNLMGKFATDHARREAIKAYQSALENQHSLVAQKVAYQISLDIRAYYPQLKTMGIDTKLLSRDARHYNLRLTRSRLTPDERQAFDRVASHQAIVAQMANTLSALDTLKSEPQPYLMEKEIALKNKLLALSQEKEPLASAIFHQADFHSAGLDYFGIGRPSHHTGFEITPESHTKAQKRWYQMEQAAFRHNAKKLVSDYQRMASNGKTIGRDKLAYALQNNIKLYYPYLMNAKVDVKAINHHALSHQRRCYFATLEAKDRHVARVAFKRVSDYLSLSAELTADYHAHGLKGDRHYKTIDKEGNITLNPDTETPLNSNDPQNQSSFNKDSIAHRHHGLYINKQSEKLHQLAHEIIQHKESYKTALEFYGVRLTSDEQAPLTADLQEQKARDYALNRGKQLENAATRYALRKTIIEAQAALAHNNSDALLKAYQLNKNLNAYHGAIRSAIPRHEDRSAFYQAIYRDAKQYEHDTYFAPLSDEGKADYLMVKAYVDSKRAHGYAWREIIEAKSERMGLSDSGLVVTGKIPENQDIKENTYYFVQTGSSEPQLYFMDKQARTLIDFKCSSTQMSTLLSSLYYSSKDKKLISPHTIENLSVKHLSRIKQVTGHTPPNKALTDVMIKTSQPYTAERNRLADQILKDPKRFEAILAHFDLTVENLNDAALAEQAKIRVESYLSVKTKLEKSALAIEITQDPKNHAGAISSNDVDWKILYQDARIQQDIEHFKTLTLPEKQLQRLSRKYRTANQSMGKLYGKIKAIPEDKRTPKQTEKLSRAFNERDKYAYKLVQQVQKLNYSFAPLSKSDTDFHTFCEDNRLKAEKIIDQHKKYAAILAREKSFKPFKPFKNLTAKQSAQENHSPATNTNAINHASYGQSPHLVKYEAEKIDLTRLKADLNDQAERVLTHYLGQPKKRQGREWRYDNSLLSNGADGSFSVTVHGKGQGLWNDFRGSHGNMFSLIQRRIGGDFKQTLNEAADFLGGKSRYLLNSPSNVIDLKAYQKRQAEKAAKEKIDLEKKIAHVKSIALGTAPIKGTLAEKYLREHRSINSELNSNNLRFHPALKNWATGSTHPALVILAHDESQQVCGVQATFLDEKTGNKAQLGKATKLSRGSISHGSTIHNPIQSHERSNPVASVIAFAEGLETALSVAEAHPDWQVKLTFGVSNFECSILNVASCRQLVENTINPQPTSDKGVAYVANVARDSTFIICADNDGKESGTAKAVNKAIENLKAQNITAHVSEPTKPNGIEKWDFNDQLKNQGINVVRADLDKALPQTTEIESIQLTPEKEKEYKDYLKHYQKLRILSEETNQESDRAELRRYSNLIVEKGKNLMKYAEKNYPLISKNIRDFSKEHTRLEILSPEKETKYKNHIKKYQSLKNAYEESNSSSSHEALIEFANKLTTGEIFMQYTYKKYPKICQNIQNYSKEYLDKHHAHHKNLDHDIDR